MILIVFIGCKTLDNKTLIEVKIKNNTNYTLENILLFDSKYSNISPYNYSQYKKVNIDNGILYLDVNKEQFVMYIKNNLIDGKNYTYSVDSLNFKNRLIYYKIVID
jgi:hypothetical protein